jgi:hypothetical protein
MFLTEFYCFHIQYISILLHPYFSCILSTSIPSYITNLTQILPPAKLMYFVLSIHKKIRNNRPCKPPAYPPLPHLSKIWSVHYHAQLALRQEPPQDDLHNQAEECVVAQCAEGLVEMVVVCLFKETVNLLMTQLFYIGEQIYKTDFQSLHWNRYPIQPPGWEAVSWLEHKHSKYKV